ncbi:MAG: putative lipoprotein [Comamonadaceae bacterium]|nr:MAG: putative lipoprotein [Comamonadaceae bacterium]
MTGCSLPRPANTPVVVDFGPGPLQAPSHPGTAQLPPLELASVHTSVALNSTAVWYRLAYADVQQLKPYTLARWSMPPAQLVGQRLRSQLGLHRAVVSPGDIALARPARVSASAAVAATPLPTTPSQAQTILNLHLELEEFSQVFERPEQSSGVLHLRATATQRSAAGETLLAQRSFIVKHPAPSPDASGGVRALTQATDQAVADIETWLAQLGQIQP